MGLNKVAEGRSIMIDIPAGGCQSGGYMGSTTIATPGVPLLIGNDMVGVPESSYAAATAGKVTVLLSGAFGNQTLHTGDAPAVGDKLYLDATDGYLTTTVGSNVWAGWCYTAPVVVNTINTCGLLLKH